MWHQSPWLIAETTSPGFQIGKSMVTEPSCLTSVRHIQDLKNSNVIQRRTRTDPRFLLEMKIGILISGRGRIWSHSWTR